MKINQSRATAAREFLFMIQVLILASPQPFSNFWIRYQMLHFTQNAPSIALVIWIAYSKYGIPSGT
jgi:hypothetical protein